MSTTWFKRFRMQFDVTRLDRLVPATHDHYSFLPWNPDLVNDHAEAKYHSFCEELDANVFPCLGNQEGCRKLMKEISCRRGFLPKATWLVVYDDPFHSFVENCGTVQGVRESADEGSIQNLGIAPEHRGIGLGTTLLIHALRGFRDSGLRRVNLEVTAHNTGAVQLYERIGFNILKIVYKSIHLDYC